MTCPADCAAGGGPACGNGVCELGAGEDCLSCAADCAGTQGGKKSQRYCCGDGAGANPVGCSDSRCTAGVFECAVTTVPTFCCGDGTAQPAEGDGLVCDGNY